MNLDGFYKKATELGLSKEQADSFLKQAVEQKSEEQKPSPEVEKFAMYAEGFVKRGMELGLSQQDSVEVLKTAVSLQDMIASPQGYGALAGGLGGAGLGALTGAAVSPEDEEGEQHQLRDALIGALLGGAGGAGAGALAGPGVAEMIQNYARQTRQAPQAAGQFPAGTSPMDVFKGNVKDPLGALTRGIQGVAERAGTAAGEAGI